MGSSKFRLSNMIPIALFYKLRNMTKTRNAKPKKKHSSPPSTASQNQNYSLFNRANKIWSSPKNPKASDTHFPDTPRKSNKKSRKSIYKSFPFRPISSVSSQQSKTLESPLPKSNSTNDMDSWSSSSATDIIIETFNVFDEMPDRNLPPILTTSARNKKQSKKKNKKETNGAAKPGSCSSGVRLRRNSPRLASKNIKGIGLEREFGSFAMVKFSLDPEKDFRESMVEMIVENNMRSSKDLEELLACYLLLNSAEYHGIIVKAFEQIWFNIPHPIKCE